MWQALRDSLHPQGFELVTVGLDTLGSDGCRPFIEAASPAHPSLIDNHHVLASTFGVINIPSSIWIDEQGMIVRPAEAAPSPPAADAPPPGEMPPGMPDRFVQMFTEASKLTADPDAYHAALKDWVANGAESPFALSPDEVVARSQPRDEASSRGHAHFELASALEIGGHHAQAIEHFREAHRLVPDSWTFRRQAWSLEPGPDGPLARFWQGPSDADPDAWPYEGDWLADVRKVGPQNYNAPWQP